MFEGLRVAVVVPARNERAFIAEVVTTMPRFVDDVLVIDDGSTDETGAIAASLGASVVRHEAAKGVGAAIACGYREALARGAAIVAVMAGDGQMCPNDLALLVGPIARGEADYAKGDRFRHADSKAMPRARRVVGGALSVMTGLATGLSGLSDSQSGYTAISRRALQAVELDAVWPGYGYPNDLLGHLARAGMRVLDVPVRPVYRGEASGLRPWHVLVISGLIGRAAWRRYATSIPRRPLVEDRADVVRMG